MNEADTGPGSPTPPGSTAVQPDPAEHRRDEQSTGSPREGIDTDNLRDYRALRRDRHDRKIAGVSGGLARHLDIDPTLVRVVMVVLVLFGGAGILLYGALWLFVPEEGSDSALIPVGESSRNVIVVVALAVALLIALPSGFDGDAGAFIGLLILGGIVAAVLLTRDSARRNAAGPTPTTGPGAAPGLHTPAGAPAWSSSVTIPPPPGSPGAPGATYGYTPKPTKRGPLLFGMALASLALALGVLGIFDANGQAVPDAAYPALALAVIGAWLVVGAFVGRPGGLVLLGAASLVALSVAQIAEPTYQGDRELVVRPATAAELAPDYDLPAGRVEIDLRGISDVEELDGRTLEVDLNAGEIMLIVPDDLTVDLDAHVTGGGEISALASNRGGWNTKVQQRLPSDDPRATMAVDLGVGFGRIDVRSE